MFVQKRFERGVEGAQKSCEQSGFRFICWSVDRGWAEPGTIPANYGLGMVADTSVEQALCPALLTALTA